MAKSTTKKSESSKKSEPVKSEPAFKEICAERIKQLRQKHGLRQDEVAEGIDRVRSSYNGLENGHYVPGVDLLIALREFYKKRGELVSMDYLLGFSDKKDGQIVTATKSELESYKSQIDMLKSALADKDNLISTLNDLISVYKDRLKIK